jgi:hypothetical protein
MLGKLSVGLHESSGQDNTKKRKPSTSGESLCESLVPPPSETKKFDNIRLSQHLGLLKQLKLIRMEQDEIEERKKVEKMRERGNFYYDSSISDKIVPDSRPV